MTFEGRFYQLREAYLQPRPQRPTPVLVGGMGLKRTLPLAARYADIWNGGGTVERIRERSDLLDELLRKEGRQPGDVRRTVMMSVLCWRNADERERRIQAMRSIHSDIGAQSVEEVLEWHEANAILGTPEQVIEQIKAYGSAGVDEIMLRWMGMDDVEGLQILADEVLAQLDAEN